MIGKDYAKIFASNLRDIAKGRGVSQRKLCEKTGVSWSSWKNWTTGYVLPNVRTLVDLCDALKCSPNDLLKGMCEYTGKQLTCVNTNDVMLSGEHGFICSECGAWDEHPHPNWCYNCGRRVINR